MRTVLGVRSLETAVPKCAFPSTPPSAQNPFSLDRYCALAIPTVEHEREPSARGIVQPMSGVSRW